MNSEIIVELPGGLEAVSVITKSSAKRLELEIGKETYVIIKATNILLAVD